MRTYLACRQAEPPQLYATMKPAPRGTELPDGSSMTTATAPETRNYDECTHHRHGHGHGHIMGMTCVGAAHGAGVLQPLFEMGSIGSTLRNTHTQQRHALQKRYIFALHNAIARTGFKLLQDGGGGEVLRRDATSMQRGKGAGQIARSDARLSRGVGYRWAL